MEASFLFNFSQSKPIIIRKDLRNLWAISYMKFKQISVESAKSALYKEFYQSQK